MSPPEYPDMETGARSLDFETSDRICKLYGWPQAFVRQYGGAAKGYSRPQTFTSEGVKLS